MGTELHPVKMLVLLLLLLSSLTSCVCGTFKVNVAHSSYQAEEEQSLTLDWTFTPGPDPSLKGLYVHCDMFNENKNPILFFLHDGSEVPLKDEDFSGRVQVDRDILREGRIRLTVSSLRTGDSGLYRCTVETDAGGDSSGCGLRVSAARRPTVSEPESLKEEVVGWKDVVSKGGMAAGLVAVLVALLIISRGKGGSEKLFDLPPV